MIRKALMQSDAEQVEIEGFAKAISRIVFESSAVNLQLVFSWNPEKKAPHELKEFDL